MTPLSGLDALFLHLETPETPMHVASLHLCDLPEGHTGDFCAEARRHIARRMPSLPMFRRKLRTFPLGIANPVWVEDDAVDLDYHVRHVRLPRPGTQAQLEACAARIHSTLLDRRRPLWEAHVIDGLETGQVAFYMRFHHAMLDGAAGMALADALLDPTPVPRSVPEVPRGKFAPVPEPTLRDLAGAALKHDVAQYLGLVRRLPDLARILAGKVQGPAHWTTSALRTPVFALGTARRAHAPQAEARRSLPFGPRTPLNVTIGCERGFAALSLSLVEAKRVAVAHEAKLNDVVLAICSGALRAYLADHGGIPEQPLIAGMPFSLRETGHAAYGTQATMTLVNLATDIADPILRLLAIRDAAGAIKSIAKRARSVIPTDTPSLGAPWLVGGLAALYGRSGIADNLPPLMNVVISNVPGPREPLYAMGARMRTCWPLSIVEHGMGLNITVVSYCGALDFGLVAARRAVPDLQRLAGGLRKAYAELLDATPAPRRRARRSPVATPSRRVRAAGAGR